MGVGAEVKQPSVIFKKIPTMLDIHEISVEHNGGDISPPFYRSRELGLIDSSHHNAQTYNLSTVRVLAHIGRQMQNCSEIHHGKRDWLPMCRVHSQFLRQKRRLNDIYSNFEVDSISVGQLSCRITLWLHTTLLRRKRMTVEVEHLRKTAYLAEYSRTNFHRGYASSRL